MNIAYWTSDLIISNFGIRNSKHMCTLYRQVFNRAKSQKTKFDVVRLGSVSRQRLVPSNIEAPDYVSIGKYFTGDNVLLKSQNELVKLKSVCLLARKTLNTAGRFVKPGVTTDFLDSIVHQSCIEQEAYPSTLNYRGFPKSCCTSVNNVALHGIPDDRALLHGDIVNIDVTLYRDGYHGDVSETFAVGYVDQRARDLISITRLCLDEAVRIVRPGVNFRKIGETIERTLAGSGFSVIPQVCGHGIGRHFHEPPDVIHVDHDCDIVMKPGMVFTIEPCVSEGGTEIRKLADGWTIVTTDDSRTAQYEHTVLVTDTGHQVLTADDRSVQDGS